MSINPTGPNSKPNPPPEEPNISVPEKVLELKQERAALSADLIAIRERMVQNHEALEREFNDILVLTNNQNKNYNSPQKKKSPKYFLFGSCRLSGHRCIHADPSSNTHDQNREAS